MKLYKSRKIINGLFVAIFALMITTACFACSGTGRKTPGTPSSPSVSDTTDPSPNKPAAWASEYGLPDADEALAKLSDLYGGADKVFLLQNGKIARMPCPHGETITLNMQYEANDYLRLVLEDSVAEFNEIFAIINPHYKFAVNYSPTSDDLAAKYSVRMSASDSLATTDTSEVFGLAHISYYAGFTELGDFGITIKREVLNNGSYFMTTFKHELMHLLGAGDAYKNSNATKNTVMQSYRVSGYHFLSKTDVAFLDTLYRNPALDGNEIDRFIETYEETTTHTRANLTAATMRLLADGIDPDSLITQAKAIGYADLTEFESAVKDGVSRDAEFGTEAVSFNEIAYTDPPEKTYCGGINATSSKYSHGWQRANGSGSSQSINYTDYGSGILYAAPNGNLYTIMIKSGNFVLSFRLYGGFTDFASLSLELWHISK